MHGHNKKNGYQSTSHILSIYIHTLCAGIHKLIAYHTVLFMLPHILQGSQTRTHKKRNTGWMNLKKKNTDYYRIMCLQSSILFNRIVLHSCSSHYSSHATAYCFIGHFELRKNYFKFYFIKFMTLTFIYVAFPLIN